MNKVRSLAGLALCLTVAALACAATSSKPERGAQFVGGWKLVAIEDTGADGRIHAEDCRGVLVFTADGHMSVQVMYVDATKGPNKYSQGGYEASYGTYQVDRHSRRFVYRVEGALVRSLIGQSQERRYTFSGNRLIIEPVDPAEHWRVTWERY